MDGSAFAGKWLESKGVDYEQIPDEMLKKSGMEGKREELKKSVNYMTFTIKGDTWTITESYSAVNDGKEISNDFVMNKECSGLKSPDGSTYSAKMEFDGKELVQHGTSDSFGKFKAVTTVTGDKMKSVMTGDQMPSMETEWTRAK